MRRYQIEFIYDNGYGYTWAVKASIMVGLDTDTGEPIAEVEDLEVEGEPSQQVLRCMEANAIDLAWREFDRAPEHQADTRGWGHMYEES